MRNKIAFIILSLGFMACGPDLSCVGCSQKTPDRFGNYDKSIPHGQISFFGSATKSFTGGAGPVFNGITTVESSLVHFNGHIFSIHDPTFGRDLYVSDLGQSGREFNSLTKISETFRFPYVLKAKDGYYMFYSKGPDVYLSKSSDLIDWSLANGGQPVLTHSEDTDSIYNQLWNVGVAIDDQDVWHLLVECSDSTPDQLHVGLAYSKAVWKDGKINFDLNRSQSHVIPHGGNPHLEFVPGKGLLAVHGQIFDEIHNMNSWYITASTLDLGSKNWLIHKNSFVIGTPDKAIANPYTAAADPTMIQLPDGTTEIMFSYAQDSIYQIFSSHSISQIYEDVKE